MRSFVALVLAFSVAACGGGGSSSPYLTNRDVAADIADHTCARAEACDALDGATYEECTGEIAGAICNQVACAADFSGDDGAVAACLADLDDYPCDAETFALPPSCNAIL